MPLWLSLASDWPVNTRSGKYGSRWVESTFLFRLLQDDFVLRDLTFLGGKGDFASSVAFSVKELRSFYAAGSYKSVY